MNIACEVCNKRIEHDEQTTVIKVGTRNKGLLPGYLHSEYGVGIAHIECLNVDHDSDYPEKTAHNLMTRMNQSEKERSEQLLKKETVIDISSEDLQKLTNKGQQVTVEKEDQVIVLRTSDFYHRVGELDG